MLDHSWYSKKLRESIDDIYIVEAEDDLSDYKPIVTVLKYNINRKFSLKKDAVLCPC